jgi:Golgin subfamily A member 7/ERF4 family
VPFCRPIFFFLAFYAFHPPSPHRANPFRVFYFFPKETVQAGAKCSGSQRFFFRPLERGIVEKADEAPSLHGQSRARPTRGKRANYESSTTASQSQSQSQSSSLPRPPTDAPAQNAPNAPVRSYSNSVQAGHHSPTASDSSPIVHLTESESSSPPSHQHRQSFHSQAFWRPLPVTSPFSPPPVTRPTTPHHRPPAARLWNPQNYSPRVRGASISTTHHEDDIPPVPIFHHITQAVAKDEYPLLTLPEQRRSRQSLQSPRSPNTSLVVEPVSSTDQSNRASVSVPFYYSSYNKPRHTARRGNTVREGNIEVMVGDTTKPTTEGLPSVPVDTGDVESGAVGDQRLLRSPSKVTLPTILQSGAERPETHHDEEGGDDAASNLEWGPSHPCYPHLNTHVPLSSPLYNSTRIIRVPRDWLVAGDLAPTFANVYPEVLDNVVSEDEFRRVIRHINEEVIMAFNPFGWRAWLDTVFGIATFWLWDDFGFSGVKRRLRSLEQWLEGWNRDIGAKEGVQIIPLRRTAYMTVCSQMTLLDKNLTDRIH